MSSFRGDHNGQFENSSSTQPQQKMAESPTQSSPTTTSTIVINNNKNQNFPQIPIEIVSEEEMALIEAAFATATRSSLSSSSSSFSLLSSLSTATQFQRRSIQSITVLSKRTLSGCVGTSSVGDIEDSVGVCRNAQKRNRVNESLLHRFRRKRGLSVTDITSTDWCEKQMEFFLLFGKPRMNEAMKAGSARHAELEEEVIKRVKVRADSVEDIWALKFINFILGANQLLFDGLTRELPIFGFVEGVLMVGVIDEIRMPITETEKNPMLVETKTRTQSTIPAEPQRRNGRLQLMCYKYLWDNMAADNFPSRQFFDFFSLNPNRILSEDIRKSTAKSGFPSETLNDLVSCFRNTCSLLPTARDQLLLRYEFQNDNSLVAEDQVEYDSDWLKGRIQFSLEFWKGERDANYTPEEERWKCKFCRFASACPVNANPEATTS